MTSPMTPPDPLHDPHATSHRTVADLPLQQALRALPVPAEPQRLEALQQRVLAQWQAAHAPAEVSLRQGAGGRGLALAGGGRRRWLLGSGMVLGGLALVLGLWMRQPDPALDELLQPDVLSQMAIGEM